MEKKRKQKEKEWESKSKKALHFNAYCYCSFKVVYIEIVKETKWINIATKIWNPKN